MNLCILFYPNDGDQAEISFINFTALNASMDSDDQEVCKAIRRAFLDPQNVASVDAYAASEITAAGALTLPCQIDRAITLYLD